MKSHKGNRSLAMDATLRLRMRRAGRNWSLSPVFISDFFMSVKLTTCRCAVCTSPYCVCLRTDAGAHRPADCRRMNRVAFWRVSAQGGESVGVVSSMPFVIVRSR